MKKAFSIIAVLCVALSLPAAEIPEGYYDAINGKQDSVLKSTLSLLAGGGTRYDYGTTTYHSTNNPPEWVAGDLKAYGTWQALPFTDRKAGGMVWDMYSNCVRYYPNKPGDSGCSLNIEHCFPKSWWGGEVNAAYKDLYHLNPSDQRANSQKSNYPPGHVAKGDKFDNGSFRMDSKSKSGYGFAVFEPEEEYRGDFARAYFYIATAYESYTWAGGTSPFDASNAMDNTSYLEFKPWLTEVLLDWHRSDPVSDKERCRADVISTIQGNRNPYIDYPELVEYIWGNRKGQAVDLGTLECAFQAGLCPDDPGEQDKQKHDTLVNLPAITAALVNAVNHDGIRGTANSGIQSNGNASATMGKSTTDGEITFSGLDLRDSAVLVFRASPYNSATSMQLDIYYDNVRDTSITETVTQETRNEVRYRLTVPSGTKSIRLVSVGGSTSKRACMQELYLLVAKKDTPSGAGNTPVPKPSTRKEIRQGRIVVIRNQSIYSILGQQIQ